MGLRYIIGRRHEAIAIPTKVKKEGDNSFFFNADRHGEQLKNLPNNVVIDLTLDKRPALTARSTKP